MAGPFDVVIPPRIYPSFCPEWNSWVSAGHTGLPAREYISFAARYDQVSYFWSIQCEQKLFHNFQVALKMKPFPLRLALSSPLEETWTCGPCQLWPVLTDQGTTVTWGMAEQPPGSWSDVRRHRWPTNLKWLLRERKRNAHLFLLPRFFFTCLQFILTQLHQGRIRHEINWLHFTRDSYLLERLGVLEPCPPPPASSRPHLSGINSG